MTSALQTTEVSKPLTRAVAPTQSSCSLQHIARLAPALATFLLDPDVSEVMVNGDGSIFVETAGFMRKAELTLSLDQRNEMAIHIARLNDQDINKHQALLDARLQDGSRVAIVYPPCSIGGPTIAIRKFQTQFFSISKLVTSGSMRKEQWDVLSEAIDRRENILTAGSTSTGKTTLVNAMGTVLPPYQRVAVIEDTSELQLHLPNMIRFEARKETRDNQGNVVPAVTIRDLVKAVLRQRPDRIILGEVRGPEAFDLLRALNTGHGGSFSTIHANGELEALEWLAALALMAMPEISYEIVQKQVASAFQIVVHLERVEGKRYIRSISRVRKVDRGEFVLEKVA